MQSESNKVMSCHVMSCHVMSCHVMSCHVMSCHVMLCYVMLCYERARCKVIMGFISENCFIVMTILTLGTYEKKMM